MSKRRQRESTATTTHPTRATTNIQTVAAATFNRHACISCTCELVPPPPIFHHSQSSPPRGVLIPLRQVPVECPSGYFCSANSFEPIKCPSGEYCPSGSELSTACPQGQTRPRTPPPHAVPHTPSLPQNFLNPPPFPVDVGTFCAAGSAHPTLCPSQYFCPTSATQPQVRIAFTPLSAIPNCAQMSANSLNIVSRVFFVELPRWLLLPYWCGRT